MISCPGSSTPDEPLKIVVFPEFCFSGAGYRTVEDVISASVRLPGPELDVLSEFAQRNSIYVAGEFLEEHEKFPDRVFNTAFLLNDSGDLIHKHHKIQCVDVIGTLRDHTPGSIFEQYVEEFGIESLYSVADTPLGKIGHIICFEIIFPEVLRLMAAGRSNREIGEELVLAIGSVKWYASQIYSKLQVKNRTEAAARARELRLFSQND